MRISSESCLRNAPNSSCRSSLKWNKKVNRGRYIHLLPTKPPFTALYAGKGARLLVLNAVMSSEPNLLFAKSAVLKNFMKIESDMLAVSLIEKGSTTSLFRIGEGSASSSKKTQKRKKIVRRLHMCKQEPSKK